MKKNVSPRPHLPCPSCPFTTTCRTSLSRHLARHSHLRPHPCTLCPLAFKLKSILVRHILRRHTPHKPKAPPPPKAFSCPHCSFSTAYKGNLKDHLGRHSEALLSCPECDYKTKSLKNLSKHRLHHVQGKRFRCCVCPYATNERASLTKHAALHTGERRLACGACGYSTSDNSNMARHRRLYCKVSTAGSILYSAPAGADSQLVGIGQSETDQLVGNAQADPDHLLDVTDEITREGFDSGAEEAAVVLTVDASEAVTPLAVAAVNCRASGRNNPLSCGRSRSSLAGRGRRRPPPGPSSGLEELRDGLNLEPTKESVDSQDEQVSTLNPTYPLPLLRAFEKVPQCQSSHPLLRAFEKVSEDIPSHFPLTYMSYRKDEKELAFVEISIDVHPANDIISRHADGSGPAGVVPPQGCSGGINSSLYTPYTPQHNSNLDTSTDFKEIWLMPLEDCDVSLNEFVSGSLLRADLTCSEPSNFSLNNSSQYAALNPACQAGELTETEQDNSSSRVSCSINLASDYTCKTETEFSLLDISSGTIDSLQSVSTVHDLTLGQSDELLPCNAPTHGAVLTPARYSASHELVVGAADVAVDACGTGGVPTVAGTGGREARQGAVLSNGASTDSLMLAPPVNGSNVGGSEYDCVLSSQSVGSFLDRASILTEPQPVDDSYDAITNSSPAFVQSNAFESSNLNDYGTIIEINTANSPLPPETNPSPACWPHACGYCAIQFRSFDALIEHNFTVHNLIDGSSSRKHSSLHVHETIDAKCFESSSASPGHETVDASSKVPQNTEFETRKDSCSVRPKLELVQKSSLDELPYSQTLKHTSKKSTQVMLQCHVCGFKSNKKRRYRAHCKTHRCEKPFNCSLCAFKTKYKNSLKVHVKLKHEPRTNEVQKIPPEVMSCHHCDFTSTHASSLRRHLKRHSLATSDHCPQLRCQYCGELFGDRLSLLHHSAAHSDEKRFACTICGYRTEFTRILKAHVARHLKKMSPGEPSEAAILQHTNLPPVAKERKPALQCKLCPYTCLNRSSLNKHRNKAHPNHGSIHCPVCSFKCDDQISLHRHTRVHVHELPHECATCGYRCRTRYLLNKHEQRHDNERTVYSCHECAFTTSAKSSIVLHMKYHPERKEYTSLRMEHGEEAGVSVASKDGDNVIATATITVNTDS